MLIAALVGMALFSQSSSAFVLRSQRNVLFRKQLRLHSSVKQTVVHTVGKAKNVGSALQYKLGAGAASGLPAEALNGGLFTVLGIETSCDDTGAAVVRSDGLILGEALASQYEIHQEFGGVVPGLARDAHSKNIDAVVRSALRQAGMASAKEVDAVAVTVGPGLEICLRVGATAARVLATEHKKPFVEVHHLEAHCLLARPTLTPYSNANDSKEKNTTSTAAAALGEENHAAAAVAASAAAVAADISGSEGERDCDNINDQTSDGGKSSGVGNHHLQVEFPFVALLVSGGHCQILLVQSVGSYVVLGGTLDDALGEAYDKAARMLGLRTKGAGGPALEALARDGDPYGVALPVPMQKRKKDCDFSYAGLKNAFRLAVQSAINKEEHDKNNSSGDDSQSDRSSSDRGSSDSSGRYEMNTRNTGTKNVNVEDASGDLPYQVRADLAASFQRVAIRHLTDRLSRALDLVGSEGAAANLLTAQHDESDESNHHESKHESDDESNDGLGHEEMVVAEEKRRVVHGGGADGGGVDSDETTRRRTRRTRSSPGVVKSLAVVGGVAANQAVREALTNLCALRDPPISLVAPPPRLCTDNGVMVAWAAIEKLRLGISDDINLPPPIECQEEEEGRVDQPVGASSPVAAGSGRSSSVAVMKKKARAMDVRPRWPLGPEFSIEP